MEHFVETEWSDFYVGSNGTIKNKTGIKFVQYAQDGVMYVGLEFDKNRRIMKRLADLVYRYHINKGRPLPPGLVIKFRDGNKSNCRAENLSVHTCHKGVSYEMDTVAIVRYELLNLSNTKNN